MNPPKDPIKFWEWFWAQQANPVVIDRHGVVRRPRRRDGWVPPR